MNTDEYGRLLRAAIPGLDLKVALSQWRGENPEAPITQFLQRIATDTGRDPFNLIDEDGMSALLAYCGESPETAEAVIAGWGVWP